MQFFLYGTILSTRVINVDNTLLQPKELAGFLVLLNQVICKFGTEVRDILESVYPVLASRAFSIIPANDIPSGPGSCGEVCELFRYI